MDGPKITVVAIVLLLVGLLAGYHYWGQSSRRLADELAAAQAKLAEAAEAQKREAAMKGRLDSAEAELKRLTDQLAATKKAKQDLELKISRPGSRVEEEPMKPIAVAVAIVAPVVGVGVGYAIWGAKNAPLETEISQAKARLADAQQASVREGAMATKLQELETQIKTATADLTTEEEAKAQLEKVAADLAAKMKP